MAGKSAEYKRRYYEKHKSDKWASDGEYRVKARLTKLHNMPIENIRQQLENIEKRQLRDAERKALLLAEIKRREDAAEG